MREEVRNWLKQAKEDLEKARILFDNKKFDGATFYSQQAVEKALKAVHISKGFGLIKTHDLSLLGRLLKLPKELLKKAILLNPFYTASRYPLGEEQIISDQESADEALNSAQEILKWCKQQIKI
jgi:HEPN domain-containing protein